jgi:hypothetical protein
MAATTIRVTVERRAGPSRKEKEGEAKREEYGTQVYRYK